MTEPLASLAEAARALSAGQFDAAAAAARRRLVQDADDADAAGLLARALLGLRAPEAALAQAARAVALEPTVAGFHVTLGRAHDALDRPAPAAAHYREATLLDPGDAEAAVRLASLLRRRKRHADAAAVLRHFLQHRPENEQALIGLGSALAAMKDGVGAQAAYGRAVEAHPASAVARNALAGALLDARRPDAALPHAREALRLNDRLVDARLTLARCLAGIRRWDEAAAQFRRALDARPADMSIQAALAGALGDAGRGEEAADVFEAALAQQGDYLPILVNYANLLKDRGSHDRAEALYRRAIAAAPGFFPTFNNLGVLLKDQGRAEAALAMFERAVELAPGFAEGDSNRLFAMHFTPSHGPAEIARAHRAWNERHATALTRAAAPHDNEPSPERRLRVGYVSPDFKAHSVAFFIDPVLEAHDRRNVEVYAYANQRGGDAVTARLRGLADSWREIAALDDDTVAGLVRADRIDILVDLAGHTSRNRMLLFARKPAPVQMTWLGYPNGTGLDAMDYRLTDARADPPGRTEAWYAEALLRLDGGFLCYRPPAAPPPVAPPPSAAAGHVTFASFNNLAKVGPALVARWAEILHAVPDARLIVKAPPLADPGPRLHVTEMFAAAGIDPARLDLVGRTPTLEEHLAWYARADIALDSFPYNGTTTTCEALWMGVPVVALAGEAHVSRVGASLLAAVGAAELVAKSEEDYVAKAVALARDPAALAGWRADLRGRLAASPLLDAGRFTRELEAAYRDAWRRWCAQRSASPVAAASPTES